MTISSELQELVQMRLNSEYQLAERIRRSMGAAAMAESPPTTGQHGAFRLMVGTWEIIAIRVRANDALKVPFYQTTPVGYMWAALYPGITIVRGGLKKRISHLYARQFGLLNKAYGTWLDDQPEIYRTAALSGINALFG